MKHLSGTALFWGVSILVLLVGCSGGPTIVPVKGVVTRHGMPVKNLRVTFAPEAGGRPSQGKNVTDAEGRFELWYDKDTRGASVGKHKVIVAFSPSSPKEETDFRAGKLKLHPDQDAIIEKYGAAGTQPLIIEITATDQEVPVKLD